MRDDERYPTVVEPEPGTDAPEVVAGPLLLDVEGRDKLATQPAEDAPIPKYDDAQKEVAHTPDSQTKLASTAPPARRICGLKRKTFFIVLAVAVIVIIAAIVGGVVGGIEANKSHNSSPATATAAVGPLQTGPIDADQRQVAVTGVSSGDNARNIQIFYNDLETTNILYRRMEGDTGGDEFNVSLEITPNYGAPLAATSQNLTDSATVQLFYVSTDSNHSTNVAQATLNCTKDDTTECTTVSNSIITSNFTNDVHAATKLAAHRFGDTFTEVWFQASLENLWSLKGDINGTEGWSATRFFSGAYPGSDLVAYGPNDTDINVFFVSNSTGGLRWLKYSDDLGPETRSNAVDPYHGSSWNASVQLTGCYVPKVNPLRVFYGNPSTGVIVSYYQTLDFSGWKKWQDPSWGKIESGIAATAWNNQVRLFYFVDGKLVVSAQNSTTWADPVDVGS